MALRKQKNYKLERSIFVFGLLLIFGIFWLPTSQAESEDIELVRNLSTRNLNFAFKYFKILAEQEDAIVSPFSLSVALAMTSFGARNHTVKQIKDALELNGFGDFMAIAKCYSSALKSLQLEGNVTLNITYKIFIEKLNRVNSEFKDIISNEFNSSVETFDFTNYGKNASNEITSWVFQTTNNKFKTLAPLRSQERYMGAVLVSAIYFKGNWEKKFSKEKTKTENFQLTNGTKVLVPMMNIMSEFNYAEDEILDSKIVQLDYSGSRIIMYVILPNKLEAFKKLKQNLTAKCFETLRKSMKPALINLKLPKFNSKDSRDFSSDLPNLQITELVSEVSVDLNGTAVPQLSGTNTFAYKVLYAAYMAVNEDGAEAAGIPQEPGVVNNNVMTFKHIPFHFQFHANHPFVFVVYDTLTKFILLIGSVDDPSK